MANNYYELMDFSRRDELVEDLSNKIMNSLSQAVATKGFATLVLSGGTTPRKLLKELSLVDFDWERVRVTLVDERWVDASSEKSNEKLLRDYFFINYAKKARFYHLKTDGKYAKDSLAGLNVTLETLSHELDVVVLGMGLDGHTASFFPNCNGLEFALNTNDLICATTASVEPKERVTLTRSYLLSTKNLFLHIEGKAKKGIFLKAATSDDMMQMPIISMMRQETPLMEVYYAD